MGGDVDSAPVFRPSLGASSAMMALFEAMLPAHFHLVAAVFRLKAQSCPVTWICTLAARSGLWSASGQSTSRTRAPLAWSRKAKGTFMSSSPSTTPMVNSRQLFDASPDGDGETARWMRGTSLNQKECKFLFTQALVQIPNYKSTRQPGVMGGQL